MDTNGPAASLPPLTASVPAVARSLFPDLPVGDVLDILDLYGTEPYERERERVQLAILKLSEGDQAKLLFWIDAAKRDYRDALANAEYPGEMGHPWPDWNRAPEGAKSAVRDEDRQQYEKWLRDHGRAR